jgi:hypothetical protein
LAHDEQGAWLPILLDRYSLLVPAFVHGFSLFTLSFRVRKIRGASLLAIAGGTFAALLSSGLIKPGSVKWETKELLIALSLSSICGVIVRVYERALTQFVTLTKDDIERIRETFRKEIGDDPQKQRLWSTFAPNYLRSEILKLLKGGLPSWMIKLAFTTGQAITDFAQGFRLRQLAEHHRHKLAPAAEAFGRFLRAAFSNPPLELMTVYHRK